jgi:imidazolonepropionase-like amidohydrolase
VRSFLTCWLFLLLLWPGVCWAQPAQPWAIVGATIVDGRRAEPYAGTVVLRGDHIVAAGADVEAPEGARLVEAQGKTLIPGLFDLHTHLRFSAVRGVYGDWGKNLKAYLYCGVTSVADYGVFPEAIPAMRRLIADGVTPAPRISYAIRFSTPAGHGTQSGRLDSIEVSTPREAQEAIRSLKPYRPDVIKVFTDGWRYGRSPDMSSMNEETLSAIVEEAHKHGWEVTTHTVTVERSKIAVRAGVNAIVHGTGNAVADEEFIGLLKSKQTVYAPTLAVYHPRGRDLLTPLLQAVLDATARPALKPPLTPPQAPRPKLTRPYEPGPDGRPVPNARRWERLLANNKKLRDAGVAFGAGSDAGVASTFHGWATLREVQLLVEAGLTPLEAIRAATANSARALGVDGERGTITAGKLADLVLVNGAPHRDIRDIEKIERVWVGGREVDRTSLARAIASEKPTPLPAAKVGPRLDDIEREDRRTRVGTLWAAGTESGNDHSRILFVRARRDDRGHALMITAQMAPRKDAFVTASLPLTRGGIAPADLSGYQGVRFEARGDGEYELLAQTRGVRDFDYHQATFSASGRRQSIRIAFSSLRQRKGKRPVSWTGKDVRMLTFRITRPAGESAWLELDNVELYR